MEAIIVTAILVVTLAVVAAMALVVWCLRLVLGLFPVRLVVGGFLGLLTVACLLALPLLLLSVVSSALYCLRWPLLLALAAWAGYHFGRRSGHAFR